MLKKLFIHEWKSSWKLETIFCAVILILTFVGGILYSNKALATLIENDSPFAAFIVSYFIFFWFSIMLFGVATVIYFLFRFYKNFYTDEGYLMHTLPVKPSQLILSKALVMFIWSVIATLVVVLSGMILLGCFATSFTDETTSLWAFWSEAFRMLMEAFPWSKVNGWTILMFIIGVLIILGAHVFKVFFGYLAVSLGQLSGKHKILASIGIYIGMSTLLQSVYSIIQVAGIQYMDGLNLYDMKESVIVAIMALVAILIYGSAYGFYAVSHYIMKNKLNLD